MGLFGSRKKVQVGTTVSRVIEDRLLPDAIRTGILKSIFEEEVEGSIPDFVLEEMLSSIGVRAERMYQYAKNHYVHGLPSGQFISATRGLPEVQALLNAIEGQPVTIDYYHFGAPNTLHIAWMKLRSFDGYNPATNEIVGMSAVKGTTVWLKDMQIVVPASQADSMDPAALEQWGTPPRAGYTPERPNSPGPATPYLAHSPVIRSSSASEEYVRVSYVYLVQMPATGEGEFGLVETPLTEYFNITTEDYDDEADYFQAKYTVGGQTKYWAYKGGIGTYPTLDAVFFTPPTVNGTFFPFAYFRYDKQSEIENKTTQAYKTSKKLVKYLGMDYDQVAEAIDENPDIADVEQAMVVMAVPANTEDELERRYLFSFFENWQQATGDAFRSRLQADITARQYGNHDITKHTLVIQDQRFTMALSTGGIFKRRVAGTVAEVGKHHSATGSFDVDLVFQDPFNPEVTFPRTVAVPTHLYRRQVTVGLYEEIEVVDLKMLYYIEGSHKVTADETDNILLIPLDRSITEAYPFPERETLYSRSLHYVFNSLVVTKVKWYQTGLFQAIMIIVAVVITVWTMGADGGTLLAAIAAGSASAAAAAAWIIIQKLVVNLIISYVLKLFVKAVGVEVALVIAVVAALYGAYDAINTGSVAGAPWAQDLLALSNGLTEGVKATLQADFADLAAQASEFDLFVEEQTKLLEAGQALLESNNLLSPFVIFGESPTDFYNRTVHSGNIGALGISAISNYVDAALTLPKLDETIDGIRYAS